MDFNRKNKKILMPVNSKRKDVETFEQYIKTWHDREDEIVFYNATEEPNALSMFFVGSRGLPLEELNHKFDKRQKEVNKLRDELIGICKSNKITNYSFIADTTTNSIGGSILERADSIGADAIIMRSPSNGFLKRASFGSVTGNVAERSKIPVITFPKIEKQRIKIGPGYMLRIFKNRMRQHMHE